MNLTNLINQAWDNLDKAIPYYVGDFKINVGENSLIIWKREEGWRETPIKRKGEPIEYKVMQWGKPVAEVTADGKLIILTKDSKLAQSVQKISIKRFVTWAKKQYAN